MKAWKHVIVIGLLGYWVIGLGGCASVKEVAKGIAGTSTKVLEEGRSRAISQQVNYGYAECYDKSARVLKEAGAYIYAKKKDMIAIYISESDTTPVGVFFQSIDGSNTQISVSSPSTYAKELIFKILSLELDRLLHPEKYPKEKLKDKENKSGILK